MKTLALEAMAYYGKEYSLTIVDRDGDSYEVLLCHNTSPPTVEERQAGERRFGHLRIVLDRSNSTEARHVRAAIAIEANERE